MLDNEYSSPGGINALEALLEPGPFKSDSISNVYSILNVTATLESVEQEFEGDVKGMMPANQPYPFTYDASMITEVSERLPIVRREISKFNGRTTVGVIVSVLGPEIDDNEPGYTTHSACGLCMIPSWKRSVIGHKD